MLHGDLHFDIPIRNGTYRVTLIFVEPVADIDDRRFHFDYDERIRFEAGFDVNKEAGGKDKSSSARTS